MTNQLNAPHTLDLILALTVVAREHECYADYINELYDDYIPSTNTKIDCDFTLLKVLTNVWNREHPTAKVVLVTYEFVVETMSRGEWTEWVSTAHDLDTKFVVVDANRNLEDIINEGGLDWVGIIDMFMPAAELVESERLVEENWDKIVEIETLVNGGEVGGFAVEYWIDDFNKLDYVIETNNPRAHQIKCCHRGNTFDWQQQYDEDDNLLNPLTTEDMEIVMDHNYDEYRDAWIERIVQLIREH